jgi:hypothetical protein
MNGLQADDDRRLAAARSPLVWTCLLAALFIAAGAMFTWRGPLRALQMGNDLAVYYTCARAWLHGGNPYDLATLQAEALQAGGAPAGLLNDALNPPTTFVLLAPLALLDWATARAVWLGVNLLSLLLALVALTRLARPELTPARTLLLAAFVLGLAPVQTSVALGQLILPVAACIVWGMVAQRSGRGYLAGVLFALAAGLRPQVGAVYLGYLLLRGWWRPVLSAALAGAVLAAASVGRMLPLGMDWLTSMRANYAAFLLGGRGDYAGAWGYQFLQLQYPLFALTQNRHVADLVAWAIAASLGGLLVWFARRARTGQDELLAFGLVSVLGLLPVFHRSYDAAILMVPLAWCLSAHGPGERRWTRAGILLALPFLVAGAALLHTLGASGNVPSWVVDSWWWQGVVVPHQIWLLLGLAVVLTAALATSARRPSGSAPALPDDCRTAPRSAT